LPLQNRLQAVEKENTELQTLLKAANDNGSILEEKVRDNEKKTKEDIQELSGDISAMKSIFRRMQRAIFEEDMFAEI
jgi:predicted RNase H-like nuclease (RuvC/YqgF family)